ncbi:MAG: hypothetical protein LBD31_08735 [Treponema sp.]|jgi:hypothetical protein|nr:hypothetical protein [Treponema sp.]
MDVAEIQDELVRLEYPHLMPDHDPDIERYYYLRSIGQARDAMAIYQARLKVRYPDDEFRTWLLRCYRSHDPAFRGLLARGYRLLGARSLERVKHILSVIAERAEAFNEKDVYSTIKTAEGILKFLPPERYEAMAAMERFLRYASVLQLRVNSVIRAAELVRSYLTDSLSIVEEERRKRSEAQRYAEEQERQRLVRADWDSYQYQKKYGARGALADLATVVFSPTDLARVEIPEFSRVEDQVIGYCIKYWYVPNDPAFERILFLYSRKYGKKNYDVFMAIRRGQEAKHRDDEILASIMSLLVTGYYYSIQGDMYLQRNWTAIKTALENQQKAKAAARTKPRRIEAPAAKKAKAPVKRPAGKAEAKADEKVPVKIAPKPKSKSVIAPRSANVRSLPAAAVARKAGTSPQGQSMAPKPAVRTKPVKVPRRLKSAQETKTTIIAQSAAIKPGMVKTAAAKPAAVPSLETGAVKPPAAAAVSVRSPAVRPVSRPPGPAMPPPAAKPADPAQPAAQRKPAQSTPAPRPAPIQQPVQPSPVTSIFKPPVPAAKPAFWAKSPAAAKPAVKSPPPSSIPKQRVFNNKTLGKAKGSVSDRLKELAGRSYDVYQDRFLAKARVSIRKVLGTGRGLFFNLPEDAEDMVYKFLRDHYSDPYMDWEDSAERKNLMSMGFDLPSLNPVIDECYRTL